MAEGITIEEVAQITDTDALWQLLRVAKRQNDRRLLRAVEQRMRELGDQSRFDTDPLVRPDLSVESRSVGRILQTLAGGRAIGEHVRWSPVAGQALDLGSELGVAEVREPTPGRSSRRVATPSQPFSRSVLVRACQ